jgi:ubiquitin-protein ligase
MSRYMAVAALRQRLLRDIAELQTKPYPNITLHIQDDKIETACLILTPEEYGPMHLTMEFSVDYPLSAPKIRMDSNVQHPNVFGHYICASILNTQQGYTSAYTLKAIAIQMLSFFSSESITQSGGAHSVELKKFRDAQSHVLDVYTCKHCYFGSTSSSSLSIGSYMKPGWDKPKQKRKKSSPSSSEVNSLDGLTLVPSTSGDTIGMEKDVRDDCLDPNETLELSEDKCLDINQTLTLSESNTRHARTTSPLIEARLPDEVLLLIFDQLDDDEDLISFAGAWPRVTQVMRDFDVIRTRELQCFCFKKDYRTAKLGVGVSFDGQGKKEAISSEFDLLSKDAFSIHKIRRSVQGIAFEVWLPLPISQRHWRNVRRDAEDSLQTILARARLNSSSEEVVYHFMNGVVVKLNEIASNRTTRSRYNWRYGGYGPAEPPQSSLTHASEKAIESYFHLFHLLLCLATEKPSITQAANEGIKKFMNGATSKSDCPNLGYFLITALISDIDISQEVLRAIIEETIIRNVVWMLDRKGSGRAELAYLEPDAISHYRLRETFKAGLTSYRILMFLNLFRKTAVGSPRKPLSVLRDEAFARHGAPPRGSAKGLADSIKRIHGVDSFLGFFAEMGLPKPCPQNFTAFLRKCVENSVAKGYSKMPFSQGHTLYLRRQLEPDVNAAPSVNPIECSVESYSFFAKYQAPGKVIGRNRGRGRGY